MSSFEKIVKSAGLVSGMTLLSRVLGLGRDMLMAALLGAGMAADCFILAFVTPNLFRRLFGEGALTMAYIPVFAGERAKSAENARAYQGAVLTRLALFLLAVTGVVEIAALAVLLFGGLAEKNALTLSLIVIMFPYMLLICLTALHGATLNSLRHFLVPALCPAILNVVWMIALLFLYRIPDKPLLVRYIGAAIVVAGLVQFCYVAHAVWKLGFRPLPLGPAAHPSIGATMRLMGPAALGMAIVQLNVLLDKLIAYTCVPGDGAPAVIYFADRLLEFPLSLIGIALGTAVFPELAEMAAQNDRKKYADTILRAVRGALYLAIPAAIGLFVMRKPIVRLLFKQGAFDAAAVERTSAVVGYYAFAVVFSSAYHLLVRAFNAIRDVKTPMKVAILSVAINFTLNMILVWPLREEGLALATAVTSLIAMVVLAATLNRREGVVWARIAAPLGKIATAALVMAAGCLFVGWTFGEYAFLAHNQKLQDAARIGICVLFSLPAYMIATKILALDEAAILKKIFWRKK